MSELTKFREQKDRFFAQDPHSPLSPEEKRVFTGLEYYPENSALRFDVTIERSKEQQAVQMQTNTGELREYSKYGVFRFEVDPQPASLTAYTSGNGEMFVPFTDATSGDLDGLTGFSGKGEHVRCLRYCSYELNSA